MGKVGWSHPRCTGHAQNCLKICLQNAQDTPRVSHTGHKASPEWLTSRSGNPGCPRPQNCLQCNSFLQSTVRTPQLSNNWQVRTFETPDLQIIDGFTPLNPLFLEHDDDRHIGSPQASNYLHLYTFGLLMLAKHVPKSNGARSNIKVYIHTSIHL